GRPLHQPRRGFHAGAGGRKDPVDASAEQRAVEHTVDRVIPIVVIVAAVALWWWFLQVHSGGRARSPLWMAFSLTAASMLYLVAGFVGYTLDRHDRFVARTAWTGSVIW